MGPGPGTVHSTGGGSSTTLNPADKGSGITLSGGNLIATGNGTPGSVRATASYSSSKFYCEMTANVAASAYKVGLGVGNGTFSLSNGSLTSASNVVLWNGDANVYTDGAGGVSSGINYTQGDVISLAYDAGNNKVWYRKNGGNWNNDVIGNQDPASNIGGITATSAVKPAFPFVFIGPTSGSQATVNFGGSAYTYTAPSGFGNF